VGWSVGVKHTISVRDGALALPNFWEFLLLLRSPFDTELPKFGVVTYVRRGLLFRASVTDSSRRGGAPTPQIFMVLIDL